MTFKTLFKGAVALIALAASTVPAYAVTHILTLTGTLANSQFNMFSIPNIGDFRTWTLNLDGMTPLLLNQGDVVQATITLDGSMTVPTSMESLFGFNLLQGGNNFAHGQPTSVSGDLTFFDTGPTGLPNDTFGAGCSNCLSNIIGTPQFLAYSFNAIQTQFTVDQLLDVDYLIDEATISYQLRDQIGAVPEPASWALMIAGFGLVGGALRRRDGRGQAKLAAS